MHKKNKLIKNHAQRSTNLEGFLFALPWMLGFLMFSLYPIIMSAYYSFTDFSAIKDPKWVGLTHYKFLFKDPLFYKSMGNTLKYVVLSVPLTIMIALLIAALLNMKIKGKGAIRSVFFLPAVVPTVASAMIWVWILDPKNGFLNRFLGIFGIKNINWLGDPRWVMTSVVLITLWGVGTTMVIFLAAMQDVPAELYEAAEIDGAGAFAKFFRVTVPGIAHVVLYQVILAIINGFQYFTQVYIIITTQSGNLLQGIQGGPRNSLLMYPLYLFYTAFSSLKMGRASAMAWILFIVVGLFTLLLVKVSKKWVQD